MCINFMWNVMFFLILWQPLPPVVKVDSTLKRSMSCYSTLMEVEQCRVLAAMPHSVKSATLLLKFLTTISECHICSGNLIAEFGELVKAHGGILRMLVVLVYMYV